MYGSPQRKGRLEVAAAPAGGSSVGLPEEVLLAVFARLGLEDRQRSLSLVCRRWQRLAHHPSLLDRLPARLGSAAHPRSLFLPRLRAFVRWLRRRAAPHAVCIALALHIPDGASRSGLRLALAELKEVLAHACPRLASLSLELNQEARAAGWLAQLRGLRGLRVASAERLRVSAQWQSCTLLRALELDGGPGRRLRITPGAALPPHLTRLALAGERSEALPPQVAQLTGLLYLTLVNARHTTTGLSSLSGLTGLESLSLEGCSALPPAAALAELSSLRALQLRWCGRPATGKAAAPQLATAGDGSLAQERRAGSSPVASGSAASSSCSTGGSRSSCDSETDGGWQQQPCCGSGTSCGDNEAALLQAALSSLTQLSLLCFASTQQHPAFPVALAGLARLQRFDWGGPTPTQPKLPPGTWLARLRSAAVPAAAAAASLAVLSAAWQLESLEVVGTAAGASPPHPEIVRWAARHPPLRSLALLRSAAAASTSRHSPSSSPGSSRHAPRSTASSSASLSAAGASPGGSPSSASTAASSGEGCGSYSSGRSSPWEGDVSLEVALQEAQQLRPALVVRCH